MFWRLHKAVFGNQIEKAISIIEGFKDSYQVVEGSPSKLAEVPFPSINEPVLAITTLQDANRLIRKAYPSVPWLYFNNDNYKVSYWLPRIDSNIPVLNREALFLPVGLLKAISEKQLNSIFPIGEKVFIKPNSGNKIFPGFSVESDSNFVKKVNDQLIFSYVEPQEMCVLSKHIEIENVEWRFWIAERKIIAYSPYSWSLEPKLMNVPEDILKVAEAMTKNNWQPDYVYVADFCRAITGEVMLIEINAASTSGVYPFRT